jgi:hypothetical protein
MTATGLIDRARTLAERGSRRLFGITGTAGRPS